MTRRDFILSGASLVAGSALCSPVRGNIGGRNSYPDAESLPYDAEVEYINSNGKQWLQTLWTPDLTKDVRIIARGGFARTSRGMFLSAYGDNAAYNLSIEFYNSLQFRWYTAGQNAFLFVCADVDEVFDIDMAYSYANDGAVVCTANGITVSGKVVARGRIVNTFPARLGTDYRLAYCWGIFGHVKVYNPDLVMDFIPVRFTNELGVMEGGMYDRVSGELFRNMGSGSFIVGPDV